jgi:FkbM family methyltransferase
MTMVSYAQNHEDVLLSRVFPAIQDGLYIDVGANDPIVDSVTKHFYDRGWNGINIEPGRALHERLCSQRRNDINLNVALSNQDAVLELIECPSNPGLSTFSQELADALRTRGMGTTRRNVPVTTLARICDRYVDRPIDFLKIDVEGHEREVIEGGDWERWRPRVVLIEATWRPERWESLLLSADYLFAMFDGLNRYYVHAENRELLAALSSPVNCCDDYISYQHHLALVQLNGLVESPSVNTQEAIVRSAIASGLGPDSLRVAMLAHRASQKYPGLSSAVKRLVRLGS